MPDLSSLLGFRKVKLKEKNRSLTVAGVERSYLVFVPEKPAKLEEGAVILAFHGLYGDPKTFSEHTRLHEEAGKAGFITVYPEGYRKSWNCGGSVGERGSVDDVVFVRALLDDLAELVQYDQFKIFATGFSNGAKFCYLLARELSERILAIAPVSGGMEPSKTAHFPERPIPVLHIHGLEDPVSPFGGGPGKIKFVGNQPSILETLDFWRELNGCLERPEILQPKAGIVVTTYASQEGGAAVTLLTIKTMGHQWPAGTEVLKEQFGPGTKEINATKKIVEFFLTERDRI